MNISQTRQLLWAKLQRNPHQRLNSPTEIAIAAELGIKIDVNRANVDDWLRLPGISIRQAQSLVELTSMGVIILSLEDLAAALSVSLTQVKIWEPVLEFCYYDFDSIIMPLRVNPNTASLEQLLEIPVIDTNLATMIFTNRQENGHYRNLAALKQRLNLDNEQITQLMHYLQF